MTAPGNPFEHLHIRPEYKRRIAVIKAVLQKPTSFSCHLTERKKNSERGGERGRERERLFKHHSVQWLMWTCKLEDKCHIMEHSPMNQDGDSQAYFKSEVGWRCRKVAQAVITLAACASREVCVPDVWKGCAPSPGRIHHTFASTFWLEAVFYLSCVWKSWRPFSGEYELYDDSGYCCCVSLLAFLRMCALT